jgi:hypothetical protein
MVVVQLVMPNQLKCWQKQEVMQKVVCPLPLAVAVAHHAEDDQNAQIVRPHAQALPMERPLLVLLLETPSNKLLETQTNEGLALSPTQKTTLREGRSSCLATTLCFRPRSDQTQASEQREGFGLLMLFVFFNMGYGPTHISQEWRKKICAVGEEKNTQGKRKTIGVASEQAEVMV